MSRWPWAQIQPLRDGLVTYRFATSADRARIIGELATRSPGMADLLVEIEADDDLRAQLEIALLAGE
jgi:hypothetical protein